MSTVARVLLGVAFVVFSLNYFVPFLPAPSEPPPAEAGAFLAAFVTSHFLTLVKAIELACGLLLLSNRLVPLAVTLLAPILVGITAFHVLLEPAGLPIPVVLIALELTLAWAYRDAFAPMLHVRTTASPLLRGPARAPAHAGAAS